VTPSARQLLGATGEDRVAGWYERAGFSVVARNWRCDRGELDLVARRGGLVVFCEVKTRTSDRFGAPIEGLTRRQAQRIRSAAVAFLAEMRRDGRGALVSRAPCSGPSSDQGSAPLGWRAPSSLRFDVACVTADGVSVVEGAL
jgi:putative endonuclease